MGARSGELKERSHQIAAGFEDPLVGVTQRFKELEQAYPYVVPLIAGQPVDQPDQAPEGGLHLAADHLDVCRSELTVKIIGTVRRSEGGVCIQSCGARKKTRLGLPGLRLAIIRICLQ